MTQSHQRYQLVQGTLDMLILRTLDLRPAHGHGIANQIFEASGELLEVDHGSLYPALQRLQRRGFIRSKWGISDNNRKAKFYSLTGSGRSRLRAEKQRWNRLTSAIAAVLGEDSLPEEA